MEALSIVQRTRSKELCKVSDLVLFFKVDANNSSLDVVFPRGSTVAAFVPMVAAFTIYGRGFRLAGCGIHCLWLRLAVRRSRHSIYILFAVAAFG